MAIEHRRERVTPERTYARVRTCHRSARFQTRRLSARPYKYASHSFDGVTIARAQPTTWAGFVKFPLCAGPLRAGALVQSAPRANASRERNACGCR